MAVLSLLLGLLALLLAVAGFFLTIIPYAGVACSALSVVCAVAGIVLGARAHSQSRSTGEDSTFAVVAIVINVFVFLASLCILATCGACNALISNSDNRSGSFVVSGPDGSVQMYTFGGDGGVEMRPDPLAPPPADPSLAPSAPPVAPADQAGAPAAPVAAEPGSAPPPALPPPPMNQATPPTR